MKLPETREPHYAECFKAPTVVMGAMAGHAYQYNPKRLTFTLARYKFVAHMLRGLGDVAEIGCADAFGSRVVAQEVESLFLFDFDPVWVQEAREHGALEFAHTVAYHDIVAAPLVPSRSTAYRFDALYMLDVIEHIRPEDEPPAMRNVCNSLTPAGVFIAGAPSLEFQAYAGPMSQGHVNCRSGLKLREDMLRYFENVFLFSMNDEVVHTGDPRMANYLFVLCTGPR